MILKLHPGPGAAIYFFEQGNDTNETRFPIGQLDVHHGRLRFEGDFDQAVEIFAKSIGDIHDVEEIRIGIGFESIKGEELCRITFEPVIVGGLFSDERTREFLTQVGELLEGMES